MSFGNQMKKQREALGLSRGMLAERLGVSASAISNYENGLSFPKEEVMLRLFDGLETDPNTLFQDSFRRRGQVLSPGEQKLVESYRMMALTGKQTLTAVADALLGYQQELEQAREPVEIREIPLYRCPAAAGYAAPVFGEDYDMIPVADGVPGGAEFAVRIQGDSMEPYIADGSCVYVNRDPLQNGDVGIFCVDGEMLCKQYYRDPLQMVYLFSLNRDRADADVLLPPDSGRMMVCFGRVMLPQRPAIPGQ